jgi:hypothetical protein
MALSYTMSMNRDLLSVKAAGSDDSLEEVREYGESVVEACRANGCVRVLCDETDLEYTLGTLDTFELAAFIAEYASNVASVAIVCAQDQFADASFWETVAVNRGLSVRAFKDEEVARDWLKEVAARGRPG